MSYAPTIADGVDRLLARADGVRDSFRQLALQPPSRRASHEARVLLEEYQDIGYDLEEYQISLEPIY